MVVPKSESFRPKTAPAKAPRSTKPGGPKSSGSDKAGGKKADPKPSIESEIQRVANEERQRAKREATTGKSTASAQRPAPGRPPGRSADPIAAQAARWIRGLNH